MPEKAKPSQRNHFAFLHSVNGQPSTQNLIRRQDSIGASRVHYRVNCLVDVRGSQEIGDLNWRERKLPTLVVE